MAAEARAHRTTSSGLTILRKKFPQNMGLPDGAGGGAAVGGAWVVGAWRVVGAWLVVVVAVELVGGGGWWGA